MRRAFRLKPLGRGTETDELKYPLLPRVAEENYPILTIEEGRELEEEKLEINLTFLFTILQQQKSPYLHSNGLQTDFGKLLQETLKLSLQLSRYKDSPLYEVYLTHIDKYIKDQTTNKIYNDDNDDNEEKIEKLKIIYVRVSSASQKNDLERQKLYMQKRYQGHLLIEDIGSGLNFNRRGLRKIIKYAINGQLEELVVAYKDRLTRFGFELIEDLIKEYSNGRIIILHKNKDLEPEEELVKDMLQIMNIFTAKMNGLRKYKEKD